MKKLTLNLLLSLALAVIALVATPACASPLAPAVAAPQQDEVSQADTVEIMSQKMGRKIKTVVIVPEQYSDPDLQEEQYPVLYLLHGAYGCYSDWPTRTNLDDMASDYSVIIVCPDGQDSWYFDSPIDPKMQFETFISKELVDYVDNNYRTIPTPGMRAITGLSMGGHGALFVGFRHPDVFHSCGSMSGGVNICHFPDNWHIKDRLGEYKSNQQLWESHSVIGLVENLKPGQNITIDDGVNDIFINENNALHEALLKKGIAHDYTVRPGEHTWSYWTNSLDFQILFFSKCFAKAAKAAKTK
jgi:S-formylglutathione hydrolase FrmB